MSWFALSRPNHGRVVGRTYSHPSIARTVVFLLGILTWHACGSDAPDSPGSSASYVATPDLSIGMVDGPEEYLFGRVSGLAMDVDGRIYVADGQADEIRVFDNDGTYAFTIGRTGAGPGELGNPCCLTIDARGRIWVRDVGNHRYNAYQSRQGSAAYVESRRMVHGAMGYHAAVTVTPEGHVVDVGAETSVDEGAMIVRFVLDSTNVVVRREKIYEPPDDSLGQAKVTIRRNGSQLTIFFHQPYGPTHLVAHSPLGGWAEAVSSRYSIRWTGPDSSFVHSIHQESVGPVLSPREQERGAEILESEAGFWNYSVSDLPFGVPDRKTPISGLEFDQAGRLWVFLNVEDGEPNRADIYDRDGALASSVGWPADVDLGSGFLSETRALGTSSDSLGVTRVVRLRIEPGD